ncbi:MAG: acetate/propionate family kinase, partial [Actinomycetota bacterium]
RTLPRHAATYAIPRIWRETWGIHRIGFHGLSVQWAASQVRVPRLVVAHLGGGCSITAVRDGRSVDTTMGFTPLEGVPMATRSGSVDPGALLYVLRERLATVDEVQQALEHESGLAAWGGSGDIREAAPEAVEVFVHRVAGAVATMAAACGGLDALVFTGGIGEHADAVREQIVGRVRFLGDFRVEVVAAREELVIAAETRRVLEGGEED